MGAYVRHAIKLPSCGFPRMKFPFFRQMLPSAFVVTLAFTLVTGGPVQAITKGDNTSNLDLGASWSGGTAPGSGAIATWSGAYTVAGSLSAAFTASTPVSWQGISIGSLSGSAAGLVSIGGTGTAVTGSQLTLGGSGIDMSAANQNAVINVVTLTLTGSTQNWNVATGRNLRLGSTGAGSANAKLTGTGSTVITITGGGVVDLNQGGASGFSDAAGFSGFNGKWVVDTGTTLRGVRNGATAFGSSTAADAITLQGGTLAVGGISGTQGNWSWTTNITLAASTSSSIDQQIFSGTGRFLKLNGVITGSGTVTFKETGATDAFNSDDFGYILSGTNTASGTIVIGGATENGISGRLTSLRVGGVGGNDTTTGAGTTGSLGTAAVTDNGVLTFSRSNAITAANNISGSGSVRVGSSGITGTSTQVLTLTGTNTYTGGTTIANGTLIVSGGSALADTGAVTVSGGTFQLNSSETIGSLSGVSGSAVNLQANTLTIGGSATTTYAGIISGSGGALVKQGSGSLTLSGINTYTGGTTISAGILRVATSDSALGTGALAFTGNATIATENGGGARSLANAITIASSMTASVDSGFATLTLAGDISGAGKLATTSTGTTVLTGSNSYTGTTTIGSGSTLQIGNSTTTGTLGTGTVTNNGTLAFQRTNTLTVSNVISGTGAVQHTGSGTTTLTGINTYTGTTTVSAGKLVINGNQSAANGTVTVGSGAALGGSGTIGGATTIQSGATLAPGNSPGLLTFTNGLTLAAGSNVEFQFVGDTLATRGTDFDAVNVTGGTLSLGSASFILQGSAIDYANAAWDSNRSFLAIDATGATYDGSNAFTLDTSAAGTFTGEGYWSLSSSTGGVSLNWTAVPEPSAALLAGIGLLGILHRRRA